MHRVRCSHAHTQALPVLVPLSPLVNSLFNKSPLVDERVEFVNHPCEVLWSRSNTGRYSTQLFRPAMEQSTLENDKKVKRLSPLLLKANGGKKRTHCSLHSNNGLVQMGRTEGNQNTRMRKKATLYAKADRVRQDFFYIKVTETAGKGTAEVTKMH